MLKVAYTKKKWFWDGIVILVALNGIVFGLVTVQRLRIKNLENMSGTTIDTFTEHGGADKTQSLAD